MFPYAGFSNIVHMCLCVNVNFAHGCLCAHTWFALKPAYVYFHGSLENVFFTHNGICIHCPPAEVPEDAAPESFICSEIQIEIGSKCLSQLNSFGNSGTLYSIYDLRENIYATCVDL